MTFTGDFTGTRTLDVAPEAIVEGSTFADRYAIEGRLGAGAQSTVYSALDMLASPPKRVALKMARSDETSLSREANLLARVHRDGDVAGVVRLVEPTVNEFGGFKYLVLEHIDGPTLRNTTLTVAEVCRMGGRIARALASIHEFDIVFADVKPENILLRDGIEPILIDFGAAREVQDSNATNLLTPAYAAPEQHAGQSPTAASDVYALAIVLQELAGPRAPKQLISILSAAKAKEPADRPSALAFAQALEETRFGPSSNRRSWFVLGLVVLILGLAGTGLVRTNQSPTTLATRPDKPVLARISAPGKVQYLALGHGHVYWSDGDGRAVFRAAIGGGPAETVTQLDGPAHQLVISGQTLFIRTPGEIWTFANGKSTRFAESTGRGGIVVDDRNIAWTNEVTGDVVLASVRNDAPLRVLASGQARPYSITMDATHVFWANEGNGTITRASRDRGDVEVLARGRSWPASTALDETHLYWVDRTAGHIMRVRKSGGEPQIVTKTSFGSCSITLDETHVYWTSTEDGRVMRVTKMGGASEVLARAQQRPFDIVLWEKRAYFTNSGPGGGVMGIVLP